MPEAVKKKPSGAKAATTKNLTVPDWIVGPVDVISKSIDEPAKHVIGAAVIAFAKLDTTAQIALIREARIQHATRLASLTNGDDAPGE